MGFIRPHYRYIVGSMYSNAERMVTVSLINLIKRNKSVFSQNFIKNFHCSLSTAFPPTSDDTTILHFNIVFNDLLQNLIV